MGCSTGSCRHGCCTASSATLIRWPRRQPHCMCPHRPQINSPCACPAPQLFKEMQRRKVPENVVALTALLKAVGSTPGPNMASQCMRIFRRMVHGPARCVRGQVHGAAPPTNSSWRDAECPAAAVACLRSPPLSFPASQLNQHHTPTPHASPGHRVKPNQATFRTVVGALREAGELGEALRVYQAMRRLYPADNSEFEGLTAAAGEWRAWRRLEAAGSGWPYCCRAWVLEMGGDGALTACLRLRSRTDCMPASVPCPALQRSGH